MICDSIDMQVEFEREIFEEINRYSSWIETIDGKSGQGLMFPQNPIENLPHAAQAVRPGKA